MTDERIEKLEARQNNSDKRHGATEVAMATMAADVRHIRSEVDNHLSVSIKGLFAKLDEMLPLVKSNAYWVGQWRKAIVWTAVIAFGGGIITTAFFLLRAFMTK